MKKLIYVLLMITPISLIAQLKVGNNPTSVNADAVFEAESANKGMLMPRVALTATNSASPLSSFTAGMVVYNTATGYSTSPAYNRVGNFNSGLATVYNGLYVFQTLSTTSKSW